MLCQLKAQNSCSDLFVGNEIKLKGSVDFRGVRGVRGVCGVHGVRGVRGARGARGIRGIRGARGVRGARGAPGARGALGAALGAALCARGADIYPNISRPNISRKYSETKCPRK